MAMEVPADSLGPEFAGYVLRITGGSDKQVRNASCFGPSWEGDKGRCRSMGSRGPG